MPVRTTRQEPSVATRLRHLRAYLAAGVQASDFLPDLPRFLDWLDGEDGEEHPLLDLAEEDLPAPVLFSRPWIADRRTWLVHLTDVPEKIAREGFTRGETDRTRLGGTTDRFGTGLYGGFGEEGPGWNFAYLARDVVRGRFEGSWGTGAVVFQAPAVVAHHETGAADYAMFWGPAVRRMVPVGCGHGHLDCFVADARDDGRLRCSRMPLPPTVAWIIGAVEEGQRGVLRAVAAPDRRP
jgi:hypothetical protein